MDKPLRKYWDARKSEIKAAKTQGKVLIRSEAGRIQVAAPYNVGFNKRARELSGRWRHRTGFWSFPWVSRRLVLDLIRDVYGAESMGQWSDYQE